MRALVATVAVAAIALPAAATSVDPKALVLRPDDVPAGFRFDPHESGLRSNKLEAKEFPETRRLFTRWGRITGYQAAYQKNGARIEGRADLFRTRGGARRLLLWADREARRQGPMGLERDRARVGTEGWAYAARTPLVFTFVLWRYKRVWAGVATLGLSKAATLALARAQQRRIADALR
ncbi:MAG: hypothetical protein ACRDNY_02800 [Gaiellaceae bacterium]